MKYLSILARIHGFNYFSDMTRTYKLTGIKQYIKYDEAIMLTALREYETKNNSLAFISAKYNIPRSVLHRHNSRFMKKQGGQPVLTAKAEDYIVENLNYCSKWGYPLDRADIKVKNFKDNLPGPDFVKSF